MGVLYYSQCNRMWGINGMVWQAGKVAVDITSKKDGLESCSLSLIAIFPLPPWLLQCLGDKCSKSAQQGIRHKNAINMNRKCVCNSLVTTILPVSKSCNLYWPSWISSSQPLKLTQFPAGMCLCSFSLVYSLMLQSTLPQRERHMKVKMYLFSQQGAFIMKTWHAHLRRTVKMPPFTYEDCTFSLPLLRTHKMLQHKAE